MLGFQRVSPGLRLCVTTMQGCEHRLPVRVARGGASGGRRAVALQWGGGSQNVGISTAEAFCDCAAEIGDRKRKHMEEPIRR